MGREEKEKRRGEGSKEPEETERWRGGRERERGLGESGERSKEKAKDLSFIEPGCWLLSFCLLF